MTINRTIVRNMHSSIIQSKCAACWSQMHVLEMNVAHPSPIRHIIVATIGAIVAWQFI
jgi:hypothetical protein